MPIIALQRMKKSYIAHAL